MTMQAILADFQRASLKLPWKLQMMAAKYIEACQANVHTPHKLMRNGANLLNQTIKRADGGCVETQRQMVRDGIDAMTATVAAELFGVTADKLEQLG